LLAPHLRRAGAEHSVASTHGHEVGWSMLPGARQALRRIGSTTSILTYVSKYTRSRFAGAFGPQAALEYLPSGVDSTVFAPDPAARAELRRRYGLGERPVIVCVSRLVPRKGQDQLIRALPEIRESVDGATLLIVGGGPYRDRLTNLASQVGVSDHVIITGSVPFDELPGHYNVGDVFAMPCRTRGGGLDVEGLGIVFLEASACGLPVIAGDSGGAPETVQEGHTGHVVPGTDPKAIAAPIVNLLANPATAQKMGQAGRAWIQSDWSWDHQAARMTGFLGR
jgi:phosphatidylinositol alpha-1,6-mannosyltransferase